MITEVTRYKTSDGKLFLSEEEAEEHELDRIREIIDSYISNILISKNNCGLKRHHITDMVISLCPDYHSTKKWIHKLESIIG